MKIPDLPEALLESEIIVLTGATAVGKTETALSWAKALDAEILSCDSLLFYRGMDIGTAKPSMEEQAVVPHYGIDLVSVDEQYSIYEYLKYSKQVAEDILSRGKRVLVTGGSGFYLKCFLKPVVDEIVIPDAIQEQVGQIYETDGLSALKEMLVVLNPNGLNGLDCENPRRAVKALERCLATNKSIIELREDFDNQPTPFDVYNRTACLLQRDRGLLRDRVAKRTCAMLISGLINEVEQLLEKGIERNLSAKNAIGYRETISFLAGELSRPELEEKINTNTSRLVKKQETWFRHQLDFDHVFSLDSL